MFDFVLGFWWSLVGVALLLYGKKSEQLSWMGVGLALGLIPWFLDGFWLLVAGIGLCVLGYFLSQRD